ncbi:MAG: hypothetical protein U0L76_08735 [Ruminococcus sp.]|nr:hypothetical protein [Ruminococcus sp.]
MLTDSRKITDGLIIFSALVSDFEKLDFKNDALAGVRANYFNSNMTPQRDKTEVTFDSKVYNLSYFMGEKQPFSWKITRNNRPYQTVKKATGGVYCVIFYSENGIINKRQYFDYSHNWLRTEYYDNYYENVLVAVLTPKVIHNITVLELVNFSTDGNRSSKILYPSLEAPRNNCSALMYSNVGMIWYDESFKPEDMPEFETLKDKSVSEGFDFSESKFSDVNVISGTIDLSSADYLEDDDISKLDYDTVDEIEDVVTEQDVSVADSENKPYSAYDKIASILAEAHKSNKDLFGEILNQTSNDMFDDEKDSDTAISSSEDSENKTEISDEEENSKNETNISENEPLSLNESETEEPIIIDDDVVSEDKNVSEFENCDSDIEFEHKNESACNIIIQTKAGRYSYYGDVDENNGRTGRGRTVTPDGLTSYDGEYQNDKRNGFGVCYYKEGNINYVGNWENGNRQGCGTGYRLSDGTMHSGKWNNNAPEGFGARFDSEGNFLDVCSYTEGKRNGTGVSFDESGNVVIKKWKDGEVVSEIVVKDGA